MEPISLSGNKKAALERGAGMTTTAVVRHRSRAESAALAGRLLLVR